MPADNLMSLTRDAYWQSDLKQWSINTDTVCNLLASNKYLVVVNGSFFLEQPEFILAYCIFTYKKIIIGRGGFVSKVHPHLQSIHAAKVYRGLGVLILFQKILAHSNSLRTVDFILGSDC